MSAAKQRGRVHHVEPLGGPARPDGVVVQGERLADLAQL
jgi:hypothetical protein